jgi:hypothetical protein
VGLLGISGDLVTVFEGIFARLRALHGNLILDWLNFADKRQIDENRHFDFRSSLG